MATFEKAIPIILQHEGGYSFHPADAGKATNRGITFVLFKRYADNFDLAPSIEGLKQLTEEQAKYIYRKEFWDEMKGDQIKDQQLANIIFDAYVNTGAWGLKLAQKEAGATPDGKIGPESIQAFNTAAPRLLFEGIKDARRQYYVNLAQRKPKNKVFLAGWLNRVESFVYNPTVK